MQRKIWIVTTLAAGLLSLTIACTQSTNQSKSTRPEVPEETGFATPHSVSQHPNTVPLSPEESLKSFRLPKGYHLNWLPVNP
jgi:hypothetical protein